MKTNGYSLIRENANAMFNTAMLFELSVLKAQAEPFVGTGAGKC